MVVVDVALRDFGRNDGTCSTKACTENWQSWNDHRRLGHDEIVIVILDQIKIVVNFGPAWPKRVLQPDRLVTFGTQDHFSGCASIFARIVVVELKSEMLLETGKTMPAISP